MSDFLIILPSSVQVLALLDTLSGYINKKTGEKIANIVIDFDGQSLVEDLH